MRVGVLGTGRMGTLHAATLSGLTGVDHVIVADLDRARIAHVAARVGAEVASDVTSLLRAGIDAAVVATPTPTHAELIVALSAAGLPVFCEKPIAVDVGSTAAVLKEVEAAGTALQVGFQRRFDAGYQALREAVLAGRLGRLHGFRAVTADPAPPPASYISSSGGIFRDCSVHDFDAIRWVTGREVAEVYATGSNRGEAFFADAGDIDTGVAMVTLDDGTLGTVYATRYNGAGYDARLEISGAAATLVAGLDARAPLASAQPRAIRPSEPPYEHFVDRFAAAYRDELSAFVEVAAGRAASPCPGAEALEALLVAEAAELSRADRRPVRVQDVRASH
jgi:myo-inositol 2-dehydrogenase/D-chiro-inositol 1-dehydrogenase